MAELSRNDKRVLGCFVAVVMVGVAVFMVYAARAGNQLFAPSAADTASAAAPAVVTSSAAPPPPSPNPVPSVLVSDNPAFDLTGSGDACRMHYYQDDQGRTVTLFNLTVDGEMITHVSGPDGIGRHDEHLTRGVNRIVYGFPLSQATDMGAVLYLPDGSSESCTISAGADTP